MLFSKHRIQRREGNDGLVSLSRHRFMSHINQNIDVGHGVKIHEKCENNTSVSSVSVEHKSIMQVTKIIR